MDDKKTCRQCGGTFPLIFYVRNPKSLCYPRITQFRPVCTGCALTKRSEAKRRNRPLEKARRAFYRHADKYIKLGEATSRNDFAEKFGWDLQQMAHDIGHVHGNGCVYCQTSFSEMGNGLSDVTIDVIDPDRLPYYQTNCRWVCSTCNSEKQRMSPEAFGEKLQAWRAWKKHQNCLKENRMAGCSLWDWASVA